MVLWNESTVDIRWRKFKTGCGKLLAYVKVCRGKFQTGTFLPLLFYPDVVLNKRVDESGPKSIALVSLYRVVQKFADKRQPHMGEG